MGNIFSGSEVVELGIEIEKNGRDFYDACAKKARDEAVGEMFRYLSREEERHIVSFKNMLDSIRQQDRAESYPGEYFAYLNALASEHIFTRANSGADLAARLKEDAQAVDMAIGLEKDSIIFYEGMKEVVPATEMAVVEELIAQEQAHLRKLVELKKTI